MSCYAEDITCKWSNELLSEPDLYLFTIHVLLWSKVLSECVRCKDREEGEKFTFFTCGDRAGRPLTRGLLVWPLAPHVCLLRYTILNHLIEESQPIVLCMNVCVKWGERTIWLLLTFFSDFSFQLANKYWAPHAKNKLPFDPKVSYIHCCFSEV